MDRRTWMKQLTRELALALAGVTLIGAPLFVRAVSQEMEPPAVLAKAAVRRNEVSAEPVRCRDCHDDRPTVGAPPSGVPNSPSRQSDNRKNTP